MGVGGKRSKPEPDWSTALKEESGGAGRRAGEVAGGGGPAWQEIKHQSINRCEAGDRTAAELQRRQRDWRGAGGKQGGGRRRKERVGGGRAVWRGPRARGAAGDLWQGTEGLARRWPRLVGGCARVQAGAGARGLVLLLLLAAGPGRGRLAQPWGALVPARRRRQGRRWLPRLPAEAQTHAQEATTAASAPGSANYAEYFRLWR